MRLGGTEPRRQPPGAQKPLKALFALSKRGPCRASTLLRELKRGAKSSHPVYENFLVFFLGGQHEDIADRSAATSASSLAIKTSPSTL